ncbi:MAG TPA: hypothetical protein VHA56_00270 [Mucilaginibacter sp.]|nr:hypothetical protein [Mucilaginibacter sp.]
MITFSDHFRPQQETISHLLLVEGKQPKTTYYCHKQTDYPWDKEELDKWYRVNFKSFPLYTSEQSNEVVIPNTFQRTYRKYHGNEAIKDTQKELRKEVDGMERDGLLLDLEEYIGEWIDNIYHDFAEAINALKAGPVFACIHDDLIVMKNLLKFYQEVRQNEGIQLNFFHNIALPKAVADQMTDVLIILLTDRIGMCEPIYRAGTTTSQVTSQDRFKIAWLASQQEFVELIHELTNKGYMALPDKGYSLQARKLAEMFDFTASQRKADANIANNLLTLLKPVFDKKLKKYTYSYDKPGYVKRFDRIPVYAPKKR